MSRTARARVVVAGVVSMGAALAACGGSAPAAWRGAPVAVVRAAAGRTIAAGSARVEVTLAEDTAGTGVSGSGLVDWARGNATLTAGRTGAQAARDDHFTVVVDGGRDFVTATSGRGAAGVPGTTAARPWLAGPPGAVATVAHARIAPLDSLLMRPGAAMDVAFLRGTVDALPYGGQEVEGVSTFRYSVHIDLALAASSSPPAQRPSLEASAAAIGPVLWPADVWIDQQGRVVRIELAQDPKLHTTTTRANLFITDDGNPLALTDLVFSHFGVPAKISLPAPDQVVEAQ
ncbi:MAG TPA: hypothetical protein VFA84_11065 [Acidimicrobiales bacterium]|nr:hypothetical protein [Acidimicrobiales bacterium]